MARIRVWDWCVVLWRRGRRQQIENAGNARELEVMFGKGERNGRRQLGYFFLCKAEIILCS